MVTYPHNEDGTYVISWKGCEWFARDWVGKPGTDETQWNNQGIYVDDDGALHVTIKNVGGTWKSSEASSKAPGVMDGLYYGYGKYRFTIASGASNLININTNCVVGPFMYYDDNCEIDFEFSHWQGNNPELLLESNQQGQEHQVAITTEPVICEFDWNASHVVYRVWNAAGTLLDTWNVTTDIPNHNMQILFQAWMIDNLPPSNGQTVDIKFTDFQINPTSDPVKTPVANFSATPTSGTTVTPIQFTDSSTNTPTSWSWNFGDGQTSTTRNPSHTYSAAGTYTVTLTATNSAGSDGETKTGYITITLPADPPVANFSGTPRSGSAPLTVQFTDLSTNNPTSWSWNFGDGQTSTARNPTHTYSAAGTYTVTLTATSSAGSDGETKTGYVTVSSLPAPVSAFSAAPIFGNAPLTVQFTNQSANSTSWSWDFGDGQTSTAQNPSHTYTTPGTYSPSLTASNAADEWSVSAKPGLIGVSRAGNPVANPYISHVINGSFDSWTGGVPTGWTLKTGYSGQVQSSDHKIGTSSLQISGNTATQYRGWIWQAVATGENYTKAKCWVKITGLTQGELIISLWDGTTETAKHFKHNCDWLCVEWRIPYSTAYSGAEIDIYTSGYLNTGANVYIDGLVFSKDYELTTTETEGSNTLSKAVTYNPGAVFSNATIVVRYDILDIPCYETGTTTCTVDGVSRACTFLPAGQGGQAYIDISSLSNASHTIAITTPYNRVGRYPQNNLLVWKGFTWTARSGQGAPQFNRWNPGGIYVDYLGRLHLTIKNVNGVWYSSEADNDVELRYGKFTWTVDQEAFNADKNTVLGLFTYETDINEHDIEMSRWEDEDAKNVSFSNQEHAEPNKKVYDAFLYPSEKVLCSIDWQPDTCRFTIVTESGTTLADYTDNDATPTTVAESLAMNLWLWGAPSNQSEIDITIYDFSYEAYVPYTAWTHREIPLAVTNPSSIDGVQTRMKISLVSGMESDGKDIRFSDLNSNPLPYFIDAIIDNVLYVYVKLPANATKIYFYYGNSEATSASSGEDTFELFEEWEAWDDTKWESSVYGNGAVNVTGAIVTLSTTAGYAKISSKATFNYPVKIRHLLTVDSVATGCRHRFNTPISADVGMFDGKIYWGSATATGYTQGAGYNIYERIYPGQYFDVQIVNNPAGTGVYSNSTYTSVSSSAISVRLQVGDPNSTAQSGSMSIYRTTVSKEVPTPPVLSFDYSDWKKNWNKIYIKNYSSTDGIQAKTNLSLLQGMSADGSDLRITDSGGNPISFWIESLVDNLFTVWIKLPKNLSLIYFHYGNSSATSVSSGVDTFDFFDDLDVENTTNWTYYGNHSYADSKLTLWNTTSTYGYAVSKATFAYNTIFEAKANYPATNHFILGYYNVSNSYRATWMGGWDTDDASQYCVTQNGAGSTNITAVDDGLGRSGRSRIYHVKFLSAGPHFVVDDYTRRSVTTHIPSSPLNIILASQTGKGNLVVDWVRVRKYVATQPDPRVVYDLAKLDPISIDVTKAIDSAGIQLTAKFPHNNIPHPKSRIVCYATGEDVENYLMFAGKVSTTGLSFGYTSDETTLVAVDDFTSLSRQTVQWHERTYATNELYDWMVRVCNGSLYDTGSDCRLGNSTNPSIPGVIFNSSLTTSRYEVTKTMLNFFGCLLKTRFGEDLTEYVDTFAPQSIDNEYPNGFGLPAPLELTYPDKHLVDNPSYEPELGDYYNKVTVHGIITSTGNVTACMASTYEVALDSTSSIETTAEDNVLEEKGTTAQTEAVKLLLYHMTNRVTVRMKFVGLVGLELYQRIRFGSGFPERLQNLTKQEPVEYVFVRNPAVTFTYTTLDTSKIPFPEWLRISSIKYHKENVNEYLEVEAVTDFIYSGNDPAIPSPYNTYLNPGMRKPIIGGTPSQIKKIAENVVSCKPSDEYGTVTAVAANGRSATVQTVSGKMVTVKTCSASTVGKTVLVTTDGKGNYYISTAG
jgi:PKD repeat protein